MEEKNNFFKKGFSSNKSKEEVPTPQKVETKEFSSNQSKEKLQFSSNQAKIDTGEGFSSNQSKKEVTAEKPQGDGEGNS